MLLTTIILLIMSNALIIRRDVSICLLITRIKNKVEFEVIMFWLSFIIIFNEGNIVYIFIDLINIFRLAFKFLSNFLYENLKREIFYLFCLSYLGILCIINFLLLKYQIEGFNYIYIFPTLGLLRLNLIFLFLGYFKFLNLKINDKWWTKKYKKNNKLLKDKYLKMKMFILRLLFSSITIYILSIFIFFIWSWGTSIFFLLGLIIILGICYFYFEDKYNNFWGKHKYKFKLAWKMYLFILIFMPFIVPGYEIKFFFSKLAIFLENIIKNISLKMDLLGDWVKMDSNGGSSGGQNTGGNGLGGSGGRPGGDSWWNLLIAGLNSSERDIEYKYNSAQTYYTVDHLKVYSLGKTPQSTNPNNVVAIIGEEPGYLNKITIVNPNYRYIRVTHPVYSCEVHLSPFDGFLKTAYNYGAGGELHAKCVARHLGSTCGMSNPHSTYYWEPRNGTIMLDYRCPTSFNLSSYYVYFHR